MVSYKLTLQTARITCSVLEIKDDIIRYLTDLFPFPSPPKDHIQRPGNNLLTNPTIIWDYYI